MGARLTFAAAGLGLIVSGSVLMVVAAAMVLLAPRADSAPAEVSAGATPISSGAPTVAVTSEPGAADPSDTPTGETVEETVEDFLTRFASAIRAGDVEFLLSRLNPIVFDRYEPTDCRKTLATARDDSFDLRLREIADSADWDWVLDGLTRSVRAVTRVELERMQRGETLIQEVHWKLEGGQWTWFTDCGDPIDGAA